MAKLGARRILSLALVILCAALSCAAPSRASDHDATSVLFIGNSYTYLPGTDDDPGLPRLFKEVAESIAPGTRIDYSAHTVPGYTLQNHLDDEDSTRLMDAHYDHVIVQGNSLEPFQLTPWFAEQQIPGVESFSVSLPKVLERVFAHNDRVTLFVPWGRSSKNEFLAEDHPGLRFPAGHPRAGQRWCGDTRAETQRLIDASYAAHSRGYPVGFARVGDAWLGLLQSDGPGSAFTDEEMYLDDYSHPTSLGSFVTALVLVREVLHLDITRDRFIPEDVDPVIAHRAIQALAR